MESFGARLKREREQRKITLDEISVSTKIGTRFLSALEQDRFDQLPGGVFNKGFVRSYARHLGLDENQAIADFVAASGTGQPEASPEEPPVLAAMAVRVPKTASKKDNHGLPWELFALSLLIIAVAFAVWGFHSREKGKASVAAPAQAKPEPANRESAKSQPANSQPAGSSTTQAGVSESAVTPAPAGNIGTPPQSFAAPANSSPEMGAFIVLIKARDDAWVSIASDGKPVSQETLTAGSEKSISAHDKVVIRTGNAGAISVSFNGKPLAPPGAYNEVKTLTFDSTGLRP